MSVPLSVAAKPRPSSFPTSASPRREPRPRRLDETAAASTDTMNPCVEEVSDSDSEPAEMDIDDVPALINASNMPAAASSSMPTQMLQPQGPSIKTTTDREQSKHYQCLYPIYFDISRTRAEGRRVGKSLAVENPLAREMADAAADLGLRTVFEPDKTHPKDWSNPGRVRVLLKHEGKTMSQLVKNKHHLYILMSQALKANPTQKNTPFRLPIAGLPMPKEMPEPAIPKGWKLNKILPLHSPALTGGGISENFLQDMMAEMAGEAGGSGASSGAETKKKIKDKKKK
ncbi:signal recognition particle subunit [Exserohilum turcicum]